MGIDLLLGIRYWFGKMVGKTISHYEISGKLGEGGMGVVYKAEDTKLGRPVALKFLSKELAGTAKARERFLREARAASAVDHPGISTTYGLEEVDGQTFIVMAYVEGESLGEKIASGPLGVEQAVDIAVQVAKGLRETHDKGIIHRDIKSANIMVTPRGQAKIMDFGLAKLAGQKTITKQAAVMGTIHYMSPEQARGKHVDQRTDIWSLGVVLYEMLAGEAPFKSDNDQATIYCIVNEEHEPLENLRDDIPPFLAQILKKMLQKDPRNRYPDMEYVVADLQAVDPASDYIPPGAAAGMKTTKLIVLPRTRFAISASVAATIACLGIVGVLFLRGPKIEPPPPSPPAVAVEPGLPSIAVLPFEDLSPEQDQEFFCDGLSDELINALAHLSGLKVVARTSSFAFKDAKMDVREIGKMLNVGTVLEGSVRRAGSSLRVNVQLVSVTDGYHVWGEKYEMDIEDIFDLQDEIALAIVDKLKVDLLGAERAQLVRRHTDNLEAYNLYLKGRWFWHKFTEDGFKKAIEYFEKATEVDPNYAVAYAGMADVYSLMPGHVHNRPKDVFPQAKKAALKALELDDTLAEAHSSLAWIKTQYDWDFVEAEKEFLRAIDLNPGLAHVYSEYGLFLMYMGRSEEAVEMTRKALEIDPVSLIINTNMIWVCFHNGEYDRAIEAANRIFEMDAAFPWSHHALGSVYIGLGKFQEGMAEFEKEKARSEEWNPVMETQIGTSSVLFGKVDVTQKALETMLQKSEEQYVPPYFVACLYFVLGDFDSGYQWLDTAYEERDYYLLNLKIQLEKLDFISSDPRFGVMMEKMGFEKAAEPLDPDERQRSAERGA